MVPRGRYVSDISRQVQPLLGYWRPWARRLSQALGRKAVAHCGWNEPPLYLPLPGEKDYDPCDFYGGDFDGIREKLPYLKDLGVTCIYLNPVFESPSNHRYNTADYMRTDPVLGSEDDLRRLAYEAKGMVSASCLTGSSPIPATTAYILTDMAGMEALEHIQTAIRRTGNGIVLNAIPTLPLLVGL